MTWDAYHRRQQVLRELAVSSDRHRDGLLPWAEREGVRTAFDSPTDLMLAVQMRWNARLRARVHRELDEQPIDLEAAVARAWRAAAADLPGFRAILDAHACDPALAEARTRELAFLASAAGLASAEDAVAPVLGGRVMARGQEILLEQQRPAGYRGRFMARVRQALVA